MKTIAFYHPKVNHIRACSMNFKNLYEKGGFSGTETALVEIARYMQLHHGFKVYMLGFSDESFIEDGVQYVAHFETDVYVPWKDLDWFCPLFYTSDYGVQQCLRKLDKHRTKVLLWFQCVLLQHHLGPLIHYDLHACCPSQYAKTHASQFIAHTWIVPNSISPLFYNGSEVLLKKVPGRWAYFAVFERGGDIAVKTFQQVRSVNPSAATEMLIASYYTPDFNRDYDTSIVKKVGSMSKQQIRDMLQTTEYFVYPLALPNSTIHHDTYASVVLEALACGVIVVTWNVACLKDVYGSANAVVFIDPPHFHGYDSQSPCGGLNLEMTKPRAIEAFANEILRIESNPAEKLRHQQNGIDWAQNHSWEKATQNMVDGLNAV
jgi:glycosyltransferase involved in cell wall biosynthesis